jgi:hypothetical protein
MSRNNFQMHLLMSYPNPIRIQAEAGTHPNQNYPFHQVFADFGFIKLGAQGVIFLLNLVSHLNTKSKDKEPLLPAGSALRHAIRLGKAIASCTGILEHLQ